MPSQEILATATLENASFSKILPGLQTAVDSTSLGTFKECPRKYLYSIVFGWTPRGDRVHLTFGLWVHSVVERYHHAKCAGVPHEDALDSVLDWLLQASWDRRLNRPWVSDHPHKHRESLIRTVIWYLDRYGPNDLLETVVLPSGKPAVELSFRFNSGFAAQFTGEQIVFCGHLDRLARLNGKNVVPDVKTTGLPLGPSYFAQFNPSNQMYMYTTAGQIIFDSPVEDIIIDGCRVQNSYTQFMRSGIIASQKSQEEWLREQGWWLGQMEACAVAGEWPANDKSCGNFGGCPFQDVCSRSPGARATALKSEFTTRIWDPLILRGDV